MRADYDGRGNRTRMIDDKDGDGNAEEVTTYEYDDEGNLVREAWDGRADETVDSVTRYDYGCWRG